MTAAAFELRPAVASDAARLSEIAQAAKRHWGYPESWLAHWRNDLSISPQQIEQYVVVVAQQQNTILGFCAASIEGQEAEIEHCWVLPEAIGRGIGQALFENIVQQLQTHHVATLKIASDPHALGFYQRMGAVQVGQEASYPPGRYLPVLELSLNT